MLIHEGKAINIEKDTLDVNSKKASWSFVLLQIVPAGVVHTITMLLMMFCCVTTASSFFGININFIMMAIVLNLVTRNVTFLLAINAPKRVKRLISTYFRP